MTSETAKFFYLLGGSICGVYDNCGFSSTLEWAKKNPDWDCVSFTETDTPTHIIAAVEGWTNFAEISVDEYLQFKQLKSL